MPPELIAILDNPDILVALLLLQSVVLLAGVYAGMSLEQFLSSWQGWRGSKRRRWKNTHRAPGAASWRGSPEADPVVPRRPDAVDQLRIVMGADFAIQPLLNKSEARVFKELDRVVIACNPDWQVMAQVSLGEVLRSKDANAYSCINSKRVDLLLVDEDCQPRHAIEYQGEGHYQGTAAARDAVKKEALRRAGIGYHEVVAGRTTPADLRRLVEVLVDKPKPAAAEQCQDQPGVAPVDTRKANGSDGSPSPGALRTP